MDVRVLQYGVTRERLQEVLEEGEGWDVIHLSGHGAPGELELETEDGSADSVTAAELVGAAGCWRRRAGEAGDGVGVLVGGDDPGRAAAAAKLPCRTISGGAGPPGLAGEPEAGELEPGRAGLEAAGGLAAELADRLGCAVLAMRYPVVDDFAIAWPGSSTSCWLARGSRCRGRWGSRWRDRTVIADPPTAGVPGAVGGDPGAVRRAARRS